MVRRRGGTVLIELMSALFALALVGASLAAALRAQAAEVRMLYEERLAWEVAAGQVELAEAAGASEGRVEILVDDPGWENLSGATCVRTVSAGEGGTRRISVDVEWAGFRAIPRRVTARTVLGRVP